MNSALGALGLRVKGSAALREVLELGEPRAPVA